MPVPPPPPPPLGPPPPPPPPAQSPPQPPPPQLGGGGGRSALLADIQAGSRLRKVSQVNDRSAPAVDKRRSTSEDVSSSAGASQDSHGVSLSGLFAGGFPTLRPVRQRDSAGKNPVSRSSSSASLRPLWNPPTDTLTSSDGGGVTHRPLAPSASAPPSPTFSSKHPPPLPVYSPPPPPPPPPPLSAPPHPPSPLSAPPPPPPPPPPFQDRPASKPPPLPSCPPPPPPFQVTKPTWLPLQPSQYISQPSTPPPPPPPSSFMRPPNAPGDRSSWSFHPPPPSPVHPEPSRFPILRDSPLGPPPPPPPLPASYTPNCLMTLQAPPPPRLASVPSSGMRSLPPSYPVNAPTRRPPAIPRSAVIGRLAPPPAPPARSPSTELTFRIPPPPPPLPPSSLRNGLLHSLADDFESKFNFHPVEDLPPPEEFKPFPRIYPSKENRAVSSKAPGFRTHLR